MPRSEPPADSDAVVVNGAAGGIGRATVASFLDEGYFVIGVDRVADVLELAGPDRYAGFHVDIEDDCALSESFTGRRAGPLQELRLRHVVGIAGGASPIESQVPPFTSLGRAEIDRILAHNFTNQVRFLQVIWPWLLNGADIDRSVTFTSSINALGAYRMPVYAAAKSALVAYARSLAGMVGRDGVRVNVVAPGATRTEWWRTSVDAGRRGSHERMANEEFEAVARFSALGRVADPADIAEAFVALSRLRHVTGQCLLVDGGQLHYPAVLDSVEGWRLDGRPAVENPD